MKKKYDELKNKKAIAKMERSKRKREGTYKTGQNMAEGGLDGYTEEELLLAAAAQKPSRAQGRVKKNKDDKPVKCKHCNKEGHTTTRSHHCLLFKGTTTDKKLKTRTSEDSECVVIPSPSTSTTTTTTGDDAFNESNPADVVDALDSLPLQDEDSSEMNSLTQALGASQTMKRTPCSPVLFRYF
jgi:hypothetical protein